LELPLEKKLSCIREAADVDSTAKDLPNQFLDAEVRFDSKTKTTSKCCTYMTLQTLQQYLMMKSCDTHQGPKFVHTTAGSIGLQGLHGISIGQKLACKTASNDKTLKT